MSWCHWILGSLLNGVCCKRLRKRRHISYSGVCEIKQKIQCAPRARPLPHSPLIQSRALRRHPLHTLLWFCYSFIICNILEPGDRCTEGLPAYTEGTAARKIFDATVKDIYGVQLFFCRKNTTKMNAYTEALQTKVSIGLCPNHLGQMLGSWSFPLVTNYAPDGIDIRKFLVNIQNRVVYIMIVSNSLAPTLDSIPAQNFEPPWTILSRNVCPIWQSCSDLVFPMVRAGA